jgi:hypothetical protein
MRIHEELKYCLEGSVAKSTLVSVKNQRWIPIQHCRSMQMQFQFWIRIEILIASKTNKKLKLSKKIDFFVNK